MECRFVIHISPLYLEGKTYVAIERSSSFARLQGLSLTESTYVVVKWILFLFYYSTLRQFEA